MNAKAKYNAAFLAAFDLDDIDVSRLEYMGIPDWDSYGHMALISEIEAIFELKIETQDVFDFSSYAKGITILNKYGIVIQ